ncbi:anion permease [Micromonospora sp. NPDC000089]|uniref:inorganic phosphate transporter n=1 Tax=unclassified Micromonospora TaxID=2617518 RepID=UPI0036873013
MDLIVVVVIVTALAFDFTNGFHDTANAMATSIATGALRPRVAVAISAVLNLVGAFLSVEVAKTISGGLVDDKVVTPAIIFGGLVGAILWNLATWLLGLPSSSSHALFGGLIGATWVAAGADAVKFGSVISKVVVPAVVSPFIAGLVALIGTYLVYVITRRANEGHVRSGFRHGQTISASLVSLAHGANDAQKTMGVITLTLIAAGSLPAGSRPPLWVIGAAGLSIAAGTYLGGWRIIRTVGHRLTRVEPQQGFAAEASAASTILASSHLGFPLSTTQVTSGAVLGAGMGRRLAEVRWGMAGRLAVAWLITLPAAGLVGALAGRVALTGTAGVVAVAVVALIAAAAMYAASRRDAVHADNVNDDDRPAESDRTSVPVAA